MRFCVSAAVALSLLGLGCEGDNESKAVQQKVAQRSVVEEAPPLSAVIIRPNQIDQQPAGSVRRAFLEYWGFLQHQAVSDAVDMIDPGLVAHIGAEQIAEAFKAQAPYFRSVKPEITDVRSADGTSTVFYEVKDIQGVETPRSVRWRQIGGAWTVIYDAFIDVAIRDAVQSATQTAIDPLARDTGRRAIQAGFSAGRLQSTYLKQQLER